MLTLNYGFPMLPSDYTSAPYTPRATVDSQYLEYLFGMYNFVHVLSNVGVLVSQCFYWGLNQFGIKLYLFLDNSWYIVGLD